MYTYTQVGNGFTANLTVNYRRPVRVGTEVKVVTRVQRVEGRKVCLCTEICVCLFGRIRTPSLFAFPSPDTHSSIQLTHASNAIGVPHRPDPGRERREYPLHRGHLPVRHIHVKSAAAAVEAQHGLIMTTVMGLLVTCEGRKGAGFMYSYDEISSVDSIVFWGGWWNHMQKH